MSGQFDRRTMLRTGAAATAMGVVGGANAATAKTSLRARLQTEIEAYLAARRKPEGITAVSAYVSRSASDPGIAVATGSTGRSSGVAIDDRTLFEIGSNTKAFTSALLMKLEAAGRLDIDQTVGDWLPQYPAWGKVKIRRLLNMTSGIPTYSEAPRFMRAQAENRFRHFTPEELVAYAYPTPGNQLPTSTGYFYSNTNYMLAGMIVAKAGGETYDHQLRQRIFKPLGMHDTFYDSWKLPDSVITRMAHGYFENPTCSEYRPDCTVGPLAPLAGKDMRNADISWTGAAGGIVSTPRDLARWIRGIFGGQVVPPAQLAQMKQLVSTRDRQADRARHGAGPRLLRARPGPVLSSAAGPLLVLRGHNPGLPRRVRLVSERRSGPGRHTELPAARWHRPGRRPDGNDVQYRHAVIRGTSGQNAPLSLSAADRAGWRLAGIHDRLEAGEQQRRQVVDVRRVEQDGDRPVLVDLVEHRGREAGTEAGMAPPAVDRADAQAVAVV